MLSCAIILVQQVTNSQLWVLLTRWQAARLLSDWCTHACTFWCYSSLRKGLSPEMRW
jgi:hypothetical protein